MKSCQQLLTFALLLILSTCCGNAEPTPKPKADIIPHNDEPQFVVITEDVIPDIENKTQKVIRVNPLDLPPLRDDPTAGNEDSSLYNIQSLMPPAHRNYMNLRRPRPNAVQSGGDSPIIRNFPEPKPQKPRQKKKHLHFLYDQEGYDGEVVSKHMRVHVAPGAYPVYYAVAKTNGRFGKFPIKGFRTQKEFLKYLMKAKVEAAAELEQTES